MSATQTKLTKEEIAKYRNELVSDGFPSTLTDAQVELILQPSCDKNSFLMNGMVKPSKAKKFWIQRLENVGATPTVIQQARNFHGI